MSDHLTGPVLDRLDDLRGEPDVLRPGTRVVTVSGSRALLRDGRPWWPRLDRLRSEPGALLVFLGERDGVRYAARAVGEAEAVALEGEAGGRFESLRTAAASLPGWQSALLYYAAGVLAWHARSLHCGVCGAATRSTHAGHRRTCTSGDCGHIQFPRADPAIITLVRRGDRCLLARQPHWPAGRYSTLAGFVEPGESLEEAVVREVAEEVGLAVGRTEYFASQPWPFPHTLMVGFRTEVRGGSVRLGEELADARWFTRAGLRASVATGEVTVPPPYALSRSLIDDWLGEQTVGSDV